MKSIVYIKLWDAFIKDGWKRYSVLPAYGVTLVSLAGGPGGRNFDISK